MQFSSGGIGDPAAHPVSRDNLRGQKKLIHKSSRLPGIMESQRTHLACRGGILIIEGKKRGQEEEDPATQINKVVNFTLVQMTPENMGSVLTLSGCHIQS